MSISTNAILIIGAGELGTAVIEHLAAHPFVESLSTSLSVLLRPSTITSADPTKSALLAHIRSLSVTPVPGDIANDSLQTLSSIFAPFNTIIGCSGMTDAPSTQTKIARAVLAAGIPRYIPWQFGVDYDAIGHEGGQGMFSEQLEIREMLRGQKGTEWKIVSTGMFMSFIFEAAFGVIVKDVEKGSWKVNALGSWANQCTFTDVDDIGRGTAEIVSNWSGIPEEIVYLAADTITYGRLADVVEKVSASKVERVEWTVDHLKKELAKDPEDMMSKYRTVFAEGRGAAWDKAGSFNVKRGIPMTVDLEEGARRYLKD